MQDREQNNIRQERFQSLIKMKKTKKKEEKSLDKTIRLLIIRII